MSIDAGGLAQMTYNNNNNNHNIVNNNNGDGFPTSGLGIPGSGFGARGSRLNSKRLSVALPPKVAPISEHQTDLPTPRTSRSHLLAGLRTQPKAPSVPASAPYHQTQHSLNGLGSSQWADQTHGNFHRGQGIPQTATSASFDLSAQYGMTAGRQIYSLPEQVLAPPNFYEQSDDVDPNVLQQMQMQHMFLAQRQQQLQQQLANITAAAQGMNIRGHSQRGSFHQSPMTPQTPQGFYLQQQQQQQQQMQSPIEVPGQPGVYLVYNPAIQGYSYAIDQNVQQQSQQPNSSLPLSQAGGFMSAIADSSAQLSEGSLPTVDQSAQRTSRSFTPPKKVPSPQQTMENVEPLPPPSATAFRRGHKKATSLAIHAFSNVADGPKTSSAATFGSQRNAFPPTPMTGTFGPGAARAGEHPVRQPRGPPPLEELTSAPTSKHEGSKNFATRQRRRALDSLLRAGSVRRGVSRSSGGSPVSESELQFPIGEEAVDLASNGSGSRKMTPIGFEMKGKRGSQGSDGGYFDLSSASSSEGEETGAFKNPPTPATPGGTIGDRKKMMIGVLNAAEKRKSLAL